MFNVRLARSFERDAKSLLKKYVSLRQELTELVKQLSANPEFGTPIGQNCYKVRLSIKSKGKGKSGGARVITYVLFANDEVILLTIYDKKVKANLSAEELNELLKEFT